jgi:hypothetical protein
MKRELTTTYLSVFEVATVLGVSTNTVLRKFAALPGVIDIGSSETMHKRRKRILRIPRSTLEQFIQQHQAKRR